MIYSASAEYKKNILNVLYSTWFVHYISSLQLPYYNFM